MYAFGCVLLLYVDFRPPGAQKGAWCSEGAFRKETLSAQETKRLGLRDA
jgi:hypothetical protein